MTFPFETITIASIDRFCEEITALISEMLNGTRSFGQSENALLNGLFSFTKTHQSTDELV